MALSADEQRRWRELEHQLATDRRLVDMAGRLDHPLRRDRIRALLRRLRHPRRAH